MELILIFFSAAIVNNFVLSYFLGICPFIGVSNKISSVPDLAYWMSEYCILGGNEGEINGNGRDLGMKSALYLAQVIHQDLVIANAAAWNWWIAVSPYNYKDGLIYIDKNKNWKSNLIRDLCI